MVTFRATTERVGACSGPVLVLHDTTEFTYKRGDLEKIGLIGKVADYRVCGLSMDSSLAVTTVGLPLGLSAIKFWTRNEQVVDLE